MLVERVVALLVEPLWPFYAPLVPIDQVHKSLATLGGQTCNLWRENRDTVSAIQFGTRCKMFPNQSDLQFVERKQRYSIRRSVCNKMFSTRSGCPQVSGYTWRPDLQFAERKQRYSICHSVCNMMFSNLSGPKASGYTWMPYLQLFWGENRDTVSVQLHQCYTFLPIESDDYS